MPLIILKTWALRIVSNKGSVIKGIFFDWFNTLAHFEPPRQDSYSQAFREFGIELPPKAVTKGILTADRYYFEENSKSPVGKRSREEQIEVYLLYPNTILNEAGINAPKETLVKVLMRVQQLYKGVTFALFDDVLPILKILKEQNFILGLLTNLTQDINPICHKLGLEPYLNFVVSSGEVGFDKPAPRFFYVALEKARIEPEEAVHVGDQYKLDVLGARGVGITPILIDRYYVYPEVSDCPRIQNLSQLAEYL